MFDLGYVSLVHNNHSWVPRQSVEVRQSVPSSIKSINQTNQPHRLVPLLGEVHELYGENLGGRRDSG